MKEVFQLILQTLFQFALKLLEFGMPDVYSEYFLPPPPLVGVAKSDSVTISVDFSGNGHMLISISFDNSSPSPITYAFQATISWFIVSKEKRNTCTWCNFFHSIWIQSWHSANFISICINLKYYYLHICFLIWTCSVYSENIQFCMDLFMPSKWL